MTTAAEMALKAIRRKRPFDVKDLLRAGLTLRYLGSGSFRDVYLMVGTGLVIKVPQFGHDGGANYKHAAQEIAAIRAVKKDKRYAEFVPYMPEVLYFGRHSGMIVMPRYNKRYSAGFASKVDALQNSLTDKLGLSNHDVHRENCGFDEHGQVKIFDCGRLFGKYEYD